MIIRKNYVVITSFSLDACPRNANHNIRIKSSTGTVPDSGNK